MSVFKYVWVHSEAHLCVICTLSIVLIQLLSELENYAQKQTQLPQGFVPCSEDGCVFKNAFQVLSFEKFPKQVVTASDANNSSLSDSQHTQTPR